ncbi:MAG: diguanylate cyclase [Candidatus Omnitrophica bacterium]|nr:diguanylate cyclase [Candidatus Omnitrophota bacterium]
MKVETPGKKKESKDIKLTVSILETLQEGIIVFNLENKIFFINSSAKRLLGVKEDETISEADKEFIFSPLFRELSENKDAFISKELYLEDQKRILEANSSPLRNLAGERTGTVVALRDITKAKEVDRLKTEFIANTSHELGTPLTTIKEFTAILLDGLAGPLKPDQREYLSIVQGNVERLNRVISELLDISKLEAGKIVLHPELVSISRLTNQIIYLMGSQVKSKGLSLHLSFSSNLPEVFVDVDRITQVLINLVGNAIKCTPAGGRISIGAGRRNENLQVMVKDTGIGVAPEDQKIIFDRFRQVGRTPGPGLRGTGLGLPICKEIIRLHDGDIWVESQPGKGSKFVFTLPIARKYRTLPEYLNVQIEFARAVGTKFSLLLLKVTNYDRIEKRLGKKEARKVLRSLRNVLGKELRKATDMIAVSQREEFYVGLPKTDIKGASILIKRAKTAICAKKFGDNNITLSLKTGLATYPTDAGTPEGLVKEVISRLK